MKIEIQGTPKEIADFVVTRKKRQSIVMNQPVDINNFAAHLSEAVREKCM